MLTQQKLNNPLDSPTRRRLSRMNPTANQDNRLLTKLFNRPQMPLRQYNPIPLLTNPLLLLIKPIIRSDGDHINQIKIIGIT